ncbi:MAG TPA: response regulator [Chryseosolibacter sp.]
MKERVQHYKNIILVDDDSDDRALFTEAVNFVDPTINVITRSDGEHLMEFLENDPGMFELIFLDLNMPRKNGKECLTEIRANKKLSNIPVIVYTTSLNPVDIEETYNLGARFFLRKPSSFEELKETLAVVLDAKFAAAEKTRDNFVVGKKLVMA